MCFCLFGLSLFLPIFNWNLQGLLSWLFALLHFFLVFWQPLLCMFGSYAQNLCTWHIELQWTFSPSSVHLLPSFNFVRVSQCFSSWLGVSVWGHPFQANDSHRELGKYSHCKLVYTQKQSTIHLQNQVGLFQHQEWLLFHAYMESHFAISHKNIPSWTMTLVTCFFHLTLHTLLSLMDMHGISLSLW